MKIKDLFLKDPTRWFERVIKIDEIEPKKLAKDLDDYVITDEIKEYLTTILDEFLESKRGQPDWVCAWISGYFGCGKTHFLKTLAAILGNLPVWPPDSNGLVKTLDYFGKRWHLPYTEHLKKEFVVKPVLINLLYSKTQETPSLCEIIYREFMVDCGYASEPWVAEMERQLKLDGLFEDFKKKVKETSGKDWEILRQTPLYTRNIMANVLPTIAPEKFFDKESALKAIEDQERAIKLNPDWLAKRLKEEAEALDPQKGRIVLLLDEVGLYVGDSHDRLMELQAFSETISKQMGKLWLIVTAQEALEEKIPEVAKVETEFQKLKDRFRMKATLTPKNISTVVQKRVLEKDAASPAFSELRKKFSERSGRLAEAAMLKGVARDINLYTRLPSEEDFLRYYPFLPFHLDLTQRALGLIRGKGYGTQGLTGRERTMLDLVRASIRPLLDKPIGMLITLDEIFNAIEEELGALRGSEMAQMKELIELEEKEKLPVQKVAKALYLLQQVGDWLPTTSENIASVLFDSMDSNYHQILDSVQQSLEILCKANYASKKEGKFRFLTGMERWFEEEVHREIAKIPNVKKMKLMREILGEKLSEFQKLRYKDIRDIEIRIEIDDQIFWPRGHIILKVYSPVNLPESTDSLEMETAKEKEKIYLLCALEPSFIKKVEYCLALEKVIDERKKEGLSEDEGRLVKEKEGDLDYLRHEELPRECLKLLKNGDLIFNGQHIGLSGKEWKRELRNAISACIEEICYDFDKAAVKVKEEDIIKILSWKGGPLPTVYCNLGIIDNSNNIREEAPILATILSEIKARVKKHDHRRTGKDLTAYFTSPPYCWDAKIVRLGLASLLRRGSISIQSEGKIYDVREVEVAEIFKNTRKFHSASFELGIILSQEEVDKASNLLAQLFGRYHCLTPPEIWQALREELSNVRENANMLSQRLRDLGLGGGNLLSQILSLSRDILKVSSAESGIKNFISKESDLTKYLGSYKKLLELHKSKDLDRAAKIKTQCHELLEQEAKSKILDLIRSGGFVNYWDEVTDVYEKALSKSKKTYALLHQEISQLMKQTMRSLKGHKAFSEKEAEAKAILDKMPPPFQCDAEEIEFGEGLRCKRCHKSFLDLNALKEKIALWKEKVLKEMESLLLKEIPNLNEEISIDSLSEFSKFEARLRAFAERAIGSGKRLKGKITIEVK